MNILAVMRRLRRMQEGGELLCVDGNYSRAIWSPCSGAIPGASLLYGPARGTYWLKDGEVHLLYEANGKPAVHYAGPPPPEPISRALFFLMVGWPLLAVAVGLVVVLVVHVSSGLSALGYAVVLPPLLALLATLVIWGLRWRLRRTARITPAPVSAPLGFRPVGRVVSADIPLPMAVRLAASVPLPAPGNRMRQLLRRLRNVSALGLAFSVSLMLTATFVLDPLATYDDDRWARSAEVLGVLGLVLFLLSATALTAVAVALVLQRHLGAAVAMPSATAQPHGGVRQQKP